MLVNVLYVQPEVFRHTAELSKWVHFEVFIDRSVLIVYAQALDKFDTYKTFLVVPLDEFDREFYLSDHYFECLETLWVLSKGSEASEFSAMISSFGTLEVWTGAPSEDLYLERNILLFGLTLHEKAL